MRNVRTALIGLGIIGATITVSAALLNRPMTYDEYVSYVAMLDYEIERAGGSITVQPSGRQPLKALEDEVLERTITETVIVLDGESMTPEAYKSFRDALIKKRR